MKFCLLLLFIMCGLSAAFCQTTTGNVYPKIAGYASIVHLIVAFDKDGSSFNFNGSYSVGFPFGLNLLKSDRIGFSFEFTPTIRSGQGTEKVSNLLFHPGFMFRRKHGFTIIARLAFETAGRFGTTAVFNKIIVAKKILNILSRCLSLFVSAMTNRHQLALVCKWALFFEPFNHHPLSLS